MLSVKVEKSENNPKTCHLLNLKFFYNYTGIMTSKTKCITQCCINCPLLRFIKSKIQLRIQYPDHP